MKTWRVLGFGMFHALTHARRPQPGFAILDLVLGAAIVLCGIASAHAQSQDPSTPDRPAPAEDRVVHPDAPITNPSGNGGIRLPLVYVPETFGKAEVRKRFGNISQGLGAGQISGDFSGDTRFGRVNPNAPWKASGGFTYSSNNGTVTRIGFLGYANYRIPPVITQTIGSGQDLTLPLGSFADLSQQQVQWMLTAGVEKTVIRMPGGETIGAVGDVFVPLNKVSPSIVVPETQVPAPTTVRGGVKLGF
jgi:hypothetical protein